ncbi:MAG: nucleotide exchange factor GrpE [Actinomycetota bacterium]
MSERDRRRGEERPKIKVTDRRRVRTESGSDGSDSPPADGRSTDRPPIVEAGGAPVLGVGEGVDTTANELEAAKRQTAEYLEHLQRLKAEFDNYRKRVLKEQTRAVEMASEPLIRKLLEVLDEFDLALIAAERKPDFERFLHGVELVYAKLQEILRSEGLERIQAEGQPFDPELHEALMQSGEAEGEPVVADVLRPGYTMKGRVIRPAGVKVVRR